MDENKSPLVSIIVITYNSAKYVLETLESAKAQTYQNIELIISDDCSTDNTVEICRNWLEENKQRFVRTELIISDKNTGVAPNCNRGLHVAKGTWVKHIAGDDVLKLNCIKEFINFVLENKDASFVVSALDVFGEGFNKEILFDEQFYKLSARKQLKEIIKILYYPGGVIGPNIFIRRTLLLEIDGFDENYPMCEDYSLIIRVTRKGERILLINKSLVIYRKHESSLTADSNNMINLHKSDVFRFNSTIIPKVCKEEGFFLYFWHYKIFFFILKNRDKALFNFKITRYLIVLFDPITWYKKISKIIF